MDVPVHELTNFVVRETSWSRTVFITHSNLPLSPNPTRPTGFAIKASQFGGVVPVPTQLVSNPVPGFLFPISPTVKTVKKGYLEMFYFGGGLWIQIQEGKFLN